MEIMEIPESSFPAIAGIIMAGGTSSRFGSNKALALFHKKPVIQRVAETISPLFPTCLLSTNTPETYTFLGLPTVKDIYPNAGPLGGIHAALKATDKPRCFVVGCDMPFLAPQLIRFLCNLSAKGDWDVVLPWPASGPEPLYGVYSRSALPVIEKNLKQRNCKLTNILTELRVRRAEEPELLTVVEDLTTFHNINRPEDLADITGA
jgi:molybdopterin-guanine dinucleotide biosynthesis protein A